MMNRIIRQIELDGEIIRVSQSPRKQRLIVERSRDGQREVVYFRGERAARVYHQPHRR